jgi:hypothetical protein
MGKKEKIVLESGKSKLPYVGGVITLFGGSVAVLILQNSLMSHHGCSHAVSVMTSMIGWLLSGVLLVAAFILSQSGSGCYVLTRERIYYRDRKGQERWEVKLCDVRNCRVRAPLLARLCGCCRLVLSLKRHERGGVRVSIGPFPADIVRAWQQEVTKYSAVEGR